MCFNAFLSVSEGMAVPRALQLHKPAQQLLPEAQSLSQPTFHKILGVYITVDSSLIPGRIIVVSVYLNCYSDSGVLPDSCSTHLLISIP